MEARAECVSEEVASAFVDATLPLSEVERIEAHVDVCEHCRALLSALFGLLPPDPHAETAPRMEGSGPSFEVRTILADRYRLVRFLGQGGMGEVYEAEDLELQTRVALKIIRGERTPSAAALERFKREVELARRVTHPNVCRTYDLGSHTSTTGERALFLTMELLPHRSLADRIARGALTEPDALPIAVQMIAGLEAAHRVGVIHCDFKSANVMLVPTQAAESLALVRAVITDFGLARTVRESTDGPAHSAMAGTPAYMAPEQVKGLVATSATDVYALGIVLFEMVTGALPFSGDTPLALASRRLTEAPQRPRALARNVSKRWEQAILSCLEREASARPSLSELLVRLRPPKRRVVQRALVLVAIAATVGATTLALVKKQAHPTGDPQARLARMAAQAFEVRRSVAVVGFQDLGSRPSDAWLSTALVEMLTAELAAGGVLRTVPSERVESARRELHVDDKGLADPEALVRLRRNLECDLLVTGSFVEVDGAAGAPELRVALRITDGRSGDVVGSFSDRTPLANIAKLVARSGAEVRRTLGAPELSESERTELQAGMSAQPDALRLYAEGIREMRLSRLEAARPSLEKAVEIDPSFALAFAALGKVLVGIGHEAEARRMAQISLDLSTPLSREQRLWVEANYRFAMSEWDKCAETYRALFSFFPDNIDYGISLANALTFAGRSAETFSTIDELRRLPKALSDDPRIDLEEARAAHSTSDFERALRASTAGMEKARARGTGLVLALSQYYYGNALKALGRMDEGLAAYRDAKRTSTEVGDRRSLAFENISITDALADRGDLAGARRELEEAKANLRGLSVRNAEASVLEHFGALDQEAGRASEAQREMEDAVDLYRAIGMKHGLAGALTGVAHMRMLMGDAVGANRACEEAINITQATGRKAVESTARAILSQLAARRGDPSTERVEADRSLELATKSGDQARVAVALAATAQGQRRRGELPRARATLDEALRVQTNASALLRAMDIRITLADLALEEHGFAEAIERAGEVEVSLHAAGAVRTEARAILVSALAHLALGSVAKAEEALKRAPPTNGTDVDLSLQLRLAAARIAMAKGAHAGLTEELSNIADRAKDAAWQDTVLEARVLAASLAPRTRRKQVLLSLGTEAEAKGFARIAREARELAVH